MSKESFLNVVYNKNKENKPMKFFVIIDGKNISIKTFHDIGEAKEFSINYLDQSKEIIIREIESVDNNKLKLE